MATVTQSVRPEQRELVTQAILRAVGLNAQAFSGAQNPSALYRRMVDGDSSIFPLYRELEDKDAAIASALATRRALVLARPAQVQAADSASGPARLFAQQAANFLDRIPQFHFAVWELLDAPAYGYSVVEILWRLHPGRVEVERMIGRPQELFRFGESFDPQTAELRLAVAGAPPQVLPPGQFLVSTFQPRHGDRRGRPLLRRLFWLSWFKRNVLRLHLKFLEKGSGTIVVRYPNGAGAGEKQQALEAAEGIADELFLAVPENFSLLTEALETTRVREGGDFRGLVDYLDAEMTRVVLGQTLTSHGAEQQRGTLSLGRIHLDILWELIRQDATELERVINEELLGPWLTWTFGPQALDRAFRPWWTLDKMPPKDLVSAADQLSKAQSLGLTLAESFVRERLEIPGPEPGEATLPMPGRAGR